MTEIGHEWGFTDPKEVTSHTMTKKEWNYWHHTRQACSMLAFMLEDIIISTDIKEQESEWWD